MGAALTDVEPPRILRVSGQMGMRTAAVLVKSYRLESVDGGTRVTTTSSISGDVAPENAADYRTGTADVLPALVRHLAGVRAAS